MSYNPNPKLYRELSKPFESSKAANDALDGFLEELGKIREKYKLPNVYCCIGFSYVAQDGEEEVGAVASMGYGDAYMHEMMLAHALGTVQAARQERVGELLAKGIKKARRAD